jgi:predicted nucleic acid-binding Zn ribbon protein
MPPKEFKVTAHKHCPICGKAMDEDSDFCSEKCKKYYTDRVKRQKKFNRLYYVSFGAILVIMVLFIILTGGGRL